MFWRQHCNGGFGFVLNAYMQSIFGSLCVNMHARSHKCSICHFVPTAAHAFLSQLSIFTQCESVRSAAHRVGGYKLLSRDHSSSTLILSSRWYRIVLTFSRSKTMFFGQSYAAPDALSLVRLMHSKIISYCCGRCSKNFFFFFFSSLSLSLSWRLCTLPHGADTICCKCSLACLWARSGRLFTKWNGCVLSANFE